uniref:F-box domain-containing protein n=1 Tax=Panagrolaimus sp. PS1159 TaxID=55785 RepID=A0AC35ER27_9BILA
MTLSLCDLPEDILCEISKRLPTTDDVLSLQTTHPKISSKINRTFWRSPKCLCLSADGEIIIPHLIFDETKQMTFSRPTWPRLLAVLTKVKNLKELVLGDCGKYFSEEILFQALIFLQKSKEIKLQKILAFYQNPDKFFKKNDEQKKDVWPTKGIHNQLCKLVEKSGKSLLFLLLCLNNSDEFVSISRNSISDSNIQIQYCHQPTFESRYAVFYPFLNGFAKGCTEIKSLSIRIKMIPSMANIMLDHCVQCCVPAHSESLLEHISVTFTAMHEKEEKNSAEKTKVTGFENFQNAGNLKSLVWFFDVSLPEEKVEKLCCPVGGDCPYDIFVQTPEMKKIYPGVPANVSLNPPKLLQCIS